MSSYAQRLATELRNAYEAHDREAFERGLRRMVETMTYAGPLPQTNDERLQPEMSERVVPVLRDIHVANITRGCDRHGHACECNDTQRATCMWRKQ